MHSNKGFTLIEMLIVIAVIAILAGVVLTGVSGFQASARDTRRIGDLRNSQNFLELYFTRCGHYPGGMSGGICDSSSDPANWDALLEMMQDPGNGFTSNFPHDPVPSRSYVYDVNSAGDRLQYVISATLERSNSALNDDSDTPPWSSIECDDVALEYCIRN